MKALPFHIPYTSAESFVVQEDLQPSFYGSLHTHPEIQITLILKSTGTAFIGDHIGDFQPGDLFIIGSGLSHVFKNDDVYFHKCSRKKAHAITIFLGTRFLNNHLVDIPETEELTSFIDLTKLGLKTTEAEFRNMRSQFEAIKKKQVSIS